VARKYRLLLSYFCEFFVLKVRRKHELDERIAEKIWDFADVEVSVPTNFVPPRGDVLTHSVNPINLVLLRAANLATGGCKATFR
jgi:hypothetical protein